MDINYLSISTILLEYCNSVATSFYNFFGIQESLNHVEFEQYLEYPNWEYLEYPNWKFLYTFFQNNHLKLTTIITISSIIFIFIYLYFILCCISLYNSIDSFFLEDEDSEYSELCKYLNSDTDTESSSTLCNSEVTSLCELDCDCDSIYNVSSIDEPNKEQIYLTQNQQHHNLEKLKNEFENNNFENLEKIKNELNYLHIQLQRIQENLKTKIETNNFGY